MIDNQVGYIIAHEAKSKEKKDVSVFDPFGQKKEDNFDNPFDVTKLGDMTLIPFNEGDTSHMQSYLIPNNYEDAMSQENFYKELETIVKDVGQVKYDIEGYQLQNSLEKHKQMANELENILDEIKEDDTKEKYGKDREDFNDDFKDPTKKDELLLTQEETNNLRDTKSLKGSLVKNLRATKFSKAYKILKEIYRNCPTLDEIVKLHGKDNYEKILPFMNLA